MVNTCDALNGTSSALLQREKSLFHTSFHSNTSNNSMGKHTHLGTNEHLLNIFQMWANTHTHTLKDGPINAAEFTFVHGSVHTFICHPHSNV